MSRLAFGGGRTGLDAKYRFIALPTVEADADADNFVCEFTGGVASNEVGVGGGLSGTDLILTQIGGVPAAVDGYREITNGSSHAFAWPLGMLNPFVTNPGGWSVLLRYRDLSPDAGDFYALAYTVANNGGGSGLILDLLASSSGASQIVNKVTNAAGQSGGVAVAWGDGAGVTPQNEYLSLLISFDYATSTYFWGIGLGEAQGLSFGDYLAQSVISSGKIFTPPPELTQFVYNSSWGTEDCAVGSRSVGGFSFGLKIGSLTLAKYPCVVPV